MIAQLVAALMISLVLGTGAEIGRLSLVLGSRLLALIIRLRLLMILALVRRRRGRIVTLALRRRGRRIVPMAICGLTRRNTLAGSMLTGGGLALFGIGTLLGRSFPLSRGATLQCHY